MADSMWSQVSSRCLLAPSRIGCANNVIHSPTASSVQPMETIHCSTFCNIGMRLPAPILLLVRGRDFLYTVRRVKEDQQKNGQRPWESWPEAVGILARGRASPGQRPCAGYLSWPCERCSSRFGAGVTLPQPACRQPVAKLGGRLAGADVEEHWGRDEAYDLAAKRAAKNTLRAKLVQE